MTAASISAAATRPTGQASAAVLQDALADIVAVELLALPGVGRRHGRPGRSEDQALQQRRRLRPRACPARVRGLSARIACTLSQSALETIASCSPG